MCRARGDCQHREEDHELRTRLIAHVCVRACVRVCVRRVRVCVRRVRVYLDDI